MDTLTPRDVAARLRVSPALVYRWIKRGDLAATSRSGRSNARDLMITFAEFERFEAARKEKRRNMALSLLGVL